MVVSDFVSSLGTGSPVDFGTMTSEQDKVRRLSTLNSLVKPDFIHTTEWLWYWQDDCGKWHLFGSDVSKQRRIKKCPKFLHTLDILVPRLITDCRM